MRQLKVQNNYTNRSDKALDKYLYEIQKFPMIELEEEVQLFREFHNGNEKAKDKILKANLRFVVSVAKQYQYQGLSLIDLINEGNIGLLKAIDRFDETYGFKFISYAVWWIRTYIMTSIKNNGRLIRLPMDKIEVINKLMEKTRNFEQEYHYLPSILEIEDISNKSIRSSIEISDKTYTSLDTTISGTDISFDNVVPGDMNVDDDLKDESLNTDLRILLKDILTEREIKILFNFFGIDCREKTLEEIGTIVNLSRERVRQLKESSLLKLRKSGKLNILKKYL